MIEISRFTLLVMSELLIGLSLLSATLLILGFRRRSKVRQAAKQLVDKIQQGKASRTERLTGKLRNGYQYQEEGLSQAVHDLIQVEMRLYQNIINSYLKQDHSAFQQLDIDVDSLVLAYQGLAPSGSCANGGEDSADKLEELKVENKRLSTDLRATMDTIGRMLNEYSAGFYSAPDGDSTPHPAMDTDEMTQTAGEVGMELKDDEVTLLAQDLGQSMESPTDDEDAGFEVVPDHILGLEDLPVTDDAMMNLATAEAEPDTTGLQAESMMDELEQIDIEMLDGTASDLEELPAEPGSLEEEWARLLEEDAASSAK